MRALFRLAGFVLLSLIIACLGLAYSGLHDKLHRADLAVVLGSKVDPNGQPSEMLKARLDHTVYLYNRRFCHLILVSGGLGQEGYDEPKVMRRYLEANGVDGDAIVEDNKGATTWDTAVDAARLMKERHLESVLIVSQYYHMPRCRLAFAKAGISTIYTSHAPFFSSRDIYALPREAAGYAAYYFR